MYALGIDLGTTFTAAATWRDGRAQIVSLGGRGAAIPSVVLLRSDETFLTGEAANRRGLTEPGRVAREFKRRLGDTTPILLGGTPQSAEALTAQLLRAVVTEVVTREGGPPSSVCVSHPANWGPYKIDLLRQAVRMADLTSVTSVSFAAEPEAAAVNYAQEQRLGVGSIVAVYDLGGGTFDAAVLRRTATGFAILGEPEGIERLGGIDFDAAVFNHVRAALGSALDDLDEDDPAAIAAVARLREECVAAKEALSADTDTAIPVLLPSVTTEVRLTRGELEAMVRPSLHGSIEALQRAVRAAGCTPEELHSVLLVGGSSRMPLVGQLVSAELGRPVAVDTHPKHAVALGAAWLAGGAITGTSLLPAVGAGGVPGRGPGGPGGGAMAGSGGAAPGGRGRPGAGLAAGAGFAAGLGAAAAASGTGSGGGRDVLPAASGRGTGPDAVAGQGIAPDAAAGGGRGAGARAGLEGSGPAGFRATPAGPASPPTGIPLPTNPSTVAATQAPGARRGGMPGGTALSGAPGMSPGTPPGGARYGTPGGTGLAGSPHGGSPGATGLAGTPPRGVPRAGSPMAGSPTSAQRGDSRVHPGTDRPAPESAPVGPPAEPGDKRRRILVAASAAIVLAVLAAVAVALNVFGDNGEQGNAGTADQASNVPGNPLPLDEQCTDEIMGNEHWVCLTAATIANGKIKIEYRTDGAKLNADGGVHLHIYGGDGDNPPARIMGDQVPESEQGKWYIEDRNPAVLKLTDQRFTMAIGDAPKVCARIAGADHLLVPDKEGGYATGNCVPIARKVSSTTEIPTQEPPADNDPPDNNDDDDPTTTTTTTDPTTTTTEPVDPTVPSEPSAPAGP
jgi:actin-like ATPase involved in cell morphogenesis